MSIRAFLALFARDLELEWRTRDITVATGLFAVLVMLILAFGVAPREAGREPNVQAAALWIAFAFAATLGLNRAFARERESGALEGLLLAPIDWSLLFVSKFASTLLFTLASEAVAFGAFMLFFPVSFEADHIGLLALIIIGVTVGHLSIGLLVAALTVSLRAREVLLPVLLFPLLIPLFLGAVTTTEAVIHDAQTRAAIARAAARTASVGDRSVDATNDTDATEATADAAAQTEALIVSEAKLFGGAWWRWVVLVVAYDVIFFALGLLLFPLIIRE